jgi:PAS domain S-box-containing protein
MLTSRYAMWLGWGKEFYFFCNDAYLPTVGIKREWVLGASARKVWAEIWPDIGPRAQSVVDTGDATWDEALLLFLQRSGYPEETYHTFSYSPVPDDDGSIGGMLCVVTEDTERVIGERRVATLRDLAAELEKTRTEDELFSAVGRLLGRHSQDLPFGLIYLFDEELRQARLVCAHPTALDTSLAPAQIDAADHEAVWPAHQVASRPGLIILPELGRKVANLPAGPWDWPPNQAVAVPLMEQGQERPAGFFVAGLNPYRPFDLAYRGFIDLLVGQLAAALSNVRAYETERKRAEALAELDRAKTAFFSNISHEFRTPLTLMLGPIEDELRNSTGPREGLELAYRNSLRLLKLVNTLLDFSRIEAGRIQASYEPTDLSTFTTDLAGVFRSAIEKAGLRLVLDCPPLPELIYVDREMWEKIVLNLISNAFKFTFEGEIKVALRWQGAQVELTVSDTGVGIPEPELAKIFQRFHRVRGTRSRTYEGTGIGLALVQELAGLHGGDVQVRSVENQGTTFTVSVRTGKAHLPAERLGEARSQAHTSAQAVSFLEEALGWRPNQVPDDTSETVEQLAPAGASAPTNLPTARILLADDNADMRDYIRRLLPLQYQVQAVADGEAALAAIRAHPPDLVLTDVMMPGLDGFALLQRVRADERTRSIPFIMLSARASEEARVEGLDAGADDYLTKPFSARELLARIRSQLELARLRRDGEQAARHGEQRLQFALDAARMVAWEWDLTSGRIFRSTNARQILGRDRQHPNDFFELVAAEDRAAVVEQVQAAIDGRGPFQFESRIVLPDGTVRWIHDQAQVFRDAQGKAVRAAGVLIDITERKQAEQALHEARTQLQAHARDLEKTVQERTAKLTEMIAELQHVSYAITHDMRAPLRAMNAFASTLMEECETGIDPNHAQEYCRRILSGANRLDKLITDALSYTKCVLLELPMEPVDLSTLIRGILETYPNLHPDHAEIRVEGELPTVLGNESLLTQCFSNLLGNAVKFVAPGIRPEVHIRTVLVNDRARISIEDNGIGIPRTAQHRLFGMFQKLDSKYEGTGIGLAIVRKVVDRMGGTVGAESEPGKGSRFWVELRRPVPE